MSSEVTVCSALILISLFAAMIAIVARVFVRAHGVAVARLNFGVRVGHDDVLYIVDAHVLHRDGELDLIAQLVVALDVLVLAFLSGMSLSPVIVSVAFTSVKA